MASLDVERLKVIKFCPLVNSINQLSSTMNNSVSLTQACIMLVNKIKALSFSYTCHTSMCCSAESRNSSKGD